VRLAFVVPRYGQDVIGGAETLVRGYAEHAVAAGHDVVVLTTCARNHFTWANELPAGESSINGVRVLRHRVSRRRDDELMTSLHARIDAGFPLDADGERAWVANTGYSQELLAAVESAASRVDALLFAPYLFASTCFGVGVRPERSLVIPCLHDEPYARFTILQDAMRSAAGLIFNSDAERRLATSLLGEVRGRVVGAGFDPVAQVDAGRARRRFGLDGTLVAYAGRRERAKNFPLLLQWITAHSRVLAPDLPVTLAAMGSSALETPSAAREVVTDLGAVDEQTKYDVLAASVAVAQLSLVESFSYVLMEGWLCGTPSIVHAQCAVTREHCEASGGGLWVESAEEFSEALRRLITDTALRTRMAAAGRGYVIAGYSWPEVMARLTSAITELVAA